MRSHQRRPDDSSAAPFIQQRSVRQVFLPLSLFSLLLAVHVTAQSPYVESIEVRVANVDVVVLDKAGRKITGLKKDDFAILEDGVPQAITNFYEVAPAQSTGPSASPETGIQAQPTPYPRMRKIIVLIDESSIEPHRRHQVLNALDAFDAGPRL